MPGRRSSAGRARGARRQSASEIQWRQASATEVAEKGGLAVSGGNGYIDPLKAIGKLKKHGRGLWAMQAVVAFAMSVIAVVTDTRYGITYWYTNTAAGGKLRDMQYAWALFNTLCAVCGVWVYLLWNEAVMGVHRDRRVFRQKVHIWLSYFTWAFGVWVTAVVLASFKNYSFTANYPTDLTCAFAGAVACCLLSDIWALGKLCSLGTYAARLEEEWRLAPHEPPAAPLISDPLRDLEEAAPGDMDEEDYQRVEREREMKEKRRKSIKTGRRRSSGGAVIPAQGSDLAGDRSELGLQQPVGGESFGPAVSEDEVMMPHAFERLWGGLEPQGEFRTHIAAAVPQTTVVRHLNERGFQVVAAGTVNGLMRVLFCAKEATSNGTGAWFLAELLQDESELTLEATFKSKRSEVVPAFVRAFLLHHIFTMADAS
eukprot:jgi/Undpi1/3538/HiC_scaffold_16.g06910.m1